MRKNIFTSIVALIGTFAFVIPVLAATTAEFSPASANLTVGQKFNVVISVNPQGTANYAEKLEINYPAGILEVTSFTLGDKWMAMTEAGYDSIDNTNGVLIKTAGYPGGFSTSAIFGTVSFSAKATGNGTIKIGNSSLAFQASSQSAITGNGIQVMVTTPAAPAPKPEIKTQVTTPVSSPSVTKPAPQKTEVVSSEPVKEVLPESQTAAASEATSSTNGNVWLWVLIIVLFNAVIVWGVMVFSRRKSN